MTTTKLHHPPDCCDRLISKNAFEGEVISIQQCCMEFQNRMHTDVQYTAETHTMSVDVGESKSWLVHQSVGKMAVHIQFLIITVTILNSYHSRNL